MQLNTNRLKRQTPEFIFSIVRYLILIAFAYVLFYPFAFMAINSIKSTGDWLDPTVEWIPKNLSLDNLKLSMQVMNYWSSLSSTMINSVVAALISFISCSFAAYGLARFEFRGKKILTGIMVLCILIPDAMIMIPSYDNFRHLDFVGILSGISKLVGTEIRPSIINTPLVFWLPSLFATGLKNGLFIYIYMQFFKGLPKELEEAAWIDGAGPWKTFLRIVLPSSGAAAVTVLVFSVVWYYNDYYQAQIFLSDNYPISVTLSNFSNLLNSANIAGKTFSLGALLLTGSFLAIIPLLIYFLFMQRKFVNSIATCGIVG